MVEIEFDLIIIYFDAMKIFRKKVFSFCFHLSFYVIYRKEIQLLKRESRDFY